MRQFVDEIGQHIVENYEKWDLTSKYSADFLNPNEISFTPLIKLDWMPFKFYPSMFILHPCAVKLTIGESAYLYRILNDMKQLKTLSVTKKLNGK